MCPAAYVAWEHASERAHFLPSRGLLHIILALDGHQGVWHLASVCIQSLESFWDSVPAGDVAYAVGDYNCKVGLGPHGVGLANESGLNLLNLASANHLQI